MSQSNPPCSLMEAGPADLPDVLRLEAACFELARRSNRRNLRRALSSSAQKVWLLRESNGEAVAALVCLLYPKTLRIYSLCVLSRCRGAGLGARLVEVAEAFARQSGRDRISLEAAVSEKTLVGWYVKLGYTIRDYLPGYYAEGVDAIRMVKHPSNPFLHT